MAAMLLFACNKKKKKVKKIIVVGFVPKEKIGEQIGEVFGAARVLGLSRFFGKGSLGDY